MTDDKTKGERIAKVMARAGLCSRREAERWIAEGRVAVDGKVLTSPAVAILPGQKVTVDGEALREAEPTRLFRYHKPRGLITSERDPEGRPTVFSTFPAELPRLLSVGRLDFNSEGLLLLTNDGELKRRLELPATGWVRRYRARVHGTPNPEALAGLKDGIMIDGIAYGSIEAVMERQQGTNAWIAVALSEGKNREVRRVLEALGMTVNRLIRIGYGPFLLGDLPLGDIAEVPPGELRRVQAALAKLPPPPPPRTPRRRERRWR